MTSLRSEPVTSGQGRKNHRRSAQFAAGQGGGGTRNALASNERARHDLKSSADCARLRHPAACGCGSTALRGAALKAPSGNKVFPGKQPWMISH